AVPTISLPDDDDEPAKEQPARRPLPTPSSTSSSSSSSSRPLPTPTTRAVPPVSPPDFLPANACTACYQPITQRAVSALRHRFHPGCFRCHHCQTRLEHIGFYPEPEGEREKRQAKPTDIRFYCHLDFHEL